jgi:hypothetical protein
VLLLHSRASIEDLALTSWKNRGTKLREFFRSDGALWSEAGVTGNLDHSRLLAWMKSPKPQDVRRFYGQYGIDNIFDSVTRKKKTQGHLWLVLSELVEKRNNIAHGDAQTEALPAQVTLYTNGVMKFANSADLVLARTLRSACGESHPPW